MKYGEIIKKACESEKINFGPVNHLLDDAHSADGIHLNEQGHKKIAEEVYNFLINIV